MTRALALAILCILPTIPGCVIGRLVPPENGQFDVVAATETKGIAPAQPSDIVVVPVAIRVGDGGFYIDLLMRGPAGWRTARTNRMDANVERAGADSRFLLDLHDQAGNPVAVRPRKHPFFFSIFPSGPQIVPQPARLVRSEPEGDSWIQEVGLRGAVREGISYTFAWRAEPSRFVWIEDGGSGAPIWLELRNPGLPLPARRTVSPGPS
jgi:hypothetical protein